MNKKVAYGLLAGALAAGAAGVLDHTGLAARWDNPLSDWRARRLAKPSVATPQVKLVLVDQYSLDWVSQNMQIKSWPWPREFYGPILDFLKRNGAKAAVFDMLYTEPSTYGVADDEALGDAAGRFGNFVGAVFLGKTTAQAKTWPDYAHFNPIQVEGLEAWLETHPGPAQEIVADGAAFPIPELSKKVAWLANVREVPDGDGVFRRVAPFRIFDGQVLPSLGFAGWLAGLDKPVQAVLGPDALEVDNRRIPLDSTGRTILKFRGKSGTHQTFTAAAMIQSEQRLLEGGEPTIRDGSVFQDAYVVFGLSAPGLKDLRSSPMGGDYPGPEIYATMLDNLLAGDFLRDAPASAVWLWVLLLALVAGVAAASARNGWQSAAAAVVLIPLPVVAGLAAWPAGFVLPAAGAMVGVVLALLGGAVVNFVLEGRQKLFIKGAFKHYLSAEVIEQIMRDPGSLKLGGERRELTIFFSDLQGFSSISERLGPEDLTKLLNDYLSDMTDIILAEGGTLDKYEGDAIIAFWNAPLMQPDHAVRAVRAAVRCQQKLAERRTEFEARTGAVLRMRIGLNTGAVVVGNMGSSNRFDYTVLGDAANLASRLEGANKALGTYLMISESTWSQTNGAFPGRELGFLRVVGRQTPVRVYEATGLAGEAAGAAEQAFAAALAQMRAGQWPEAAEAFARLADDAAAKTYAAKCRALAAAGPAAAWDGIWNLTEK